MNRKVGGGAMAVWRTIITFEARSEAGEHGSIVRPGQGTRTPNDWATIETYRTSFSLPE
jgi:hypothetical protein